MNRDEGQYQLSQLLMNFLVFKHLDQNPQANNMAILLSLHQAVFPGLIACHLFSVETDGGLASKRPDSTVSETFRSVC